MILNAAAFNELRALRLITLASDAACAHRLASRGGVPWSPVPGWHGRQEGGQPFVIECAALGQLV